MTTTGKVPRDRPRHRKARCAAARPRRRRVDVHRRGRGRASRPREADRQPDADGHRPPRQADRRPHPAHQGLRAAGRARRPRVRRLGRLSRPTPTRRPAPRACSRSATSRPIKGASKASSPWTRCSTRSGSRSSTGPNVKKGKPKMELAEQVLRPTSSASAPRTSCDRLVMVWCGSTEAYREPGEVHQSDRDVRAGPRRQPPRDQPEPDLRVRRAPEPGSLRQRRAEPAAATSRHDRAGRAQRRADRRQGLQDRSDADEDDPGARLQEPLLGLNGWYSTNILGNRDGEVLDDPENFKSKEVSQARRARHIFQPEEYPDLYGDISHVVRINYYPPRGDNKEGWDNIDIFGWMGYPMQIKVDFLCRDSILGRAARARPRAVLRPRGARRA